MIRNLDSVLQGHKEPGSHVLSELCESRISSQTPERMKWFLQILLDLKVSD